MKIQVRRGVFETNSSSVHSLCICSEDDYDRFKNGELFYNSYEQILTKNSDDMTYEDFLRELEYYEGYEEYYTTKSGDNIVVFGYHGFD